MIISRLKSQVSFANIEPNIYLNCRYCYTSVDSLLPNRIAWGQKRETTRGAGPATRLFIRMRHFFTTELLRPTELLSP